MINKAKQNIWGYFKTHPQFELGDAEGKGIGANVHLCHANQNTHSAFSLCAQLYICKFQSCFLISPGSANMPRELSIHFIKHNYRKAISL